MDVREKSSNGKRLIDAIDAWNRRFDEQNKILEEQNVMLARLFELLGGKE